MLIVRAADDAARSAARLRARGHEVLIAPLLVPRGLDWAAPDARFDAVMLTSARALAFAPERARPLLALPCWCVGATTAEAAHRAGFTDLRAPAVDNAAALLARIGAARVLHLAGRDRTVLTAAPGMLLDVVETYAVDLVPLDPAARAQFQAGRIDWTLLHSPRTAAHFAAQIDAAGIARPRLAIAAISPLALAAAGAGWRLARAAVQPTEDALLTVAGL